MTAGLRLGALGVLRSARRVEQTFRAVRLDVAGFVGVAPRGPANIAVPVRSWSDYQRRFGRFEGPGRLPHAVDAFFRQGGAEAYVVRVVPPEPEPATARFRLGPVELEARDEGTWGSALSIVVSRDATQRFRGHVSATGLELPSGVVVPVGSRLATADGVRWVVSVTRTGVVLDRPLPTGAAEVTVVTASVEITDGDRDFPRAESFSGLGLRPEHPRFALDELYRRSLLVNPIGSWRVPLPLDPLFPSMIARLTRAGIDRYTGIDYRSFFDDRPADDDPMDEKEHRGVDLMGRVSEIGLLAVPDLHWEWGVDTEQITEPDRLRAAGEFERCAPPPPSVRQRVRSEVDVPYDEVVRRQRRVVDVARLRKRFVALLDVPRGLPAGTIARWRAEFDTSYAAAYHPWLGVAKPDLTLVPPSAFAAGIIAARERTLGLPWGPANELALAAVRSAEEVSAAEWAVLHLDGVNVFRPERDGFRLTAARTLSRDPEYLQLSVRRLMTMLALTISRQSQWLVFEPNTAEQRTKLRDTLVQLLREQYRLGAFAGSTEDESFFVHCDERTNPVSSQSLGRLVAEIGVAPAAPLEYLVLRVAQDVDGGMSVEAGP